jgi:hypothetical protein
MRRYLIVANQTLGGDQLTAKLAEYMRAGPCRFYLVAPVTQTEGSDQGAAGGLDGGVIPGAYRIARALAQGRLQQELNRLHEAGADADGESSTPIPSTRSASWPVARTLMRSSCPPCRGACRAGWRWIYPTASDAAARCR